MCLLFIETNDTLLYAGSETRARRVLKPRLPCSAHVPQGFYAHGHEISRDPSRIRLSCKKKRRNLWPEAEHDEYDWQSNKEKFASGGGARRPVMDGTRMTVIKSIKSNQIIFIFPKNVWKRGRNNKWRLVHLTRVRAPLYKDACLTCYTC